MTAARKKRKRIVKPAVNGIFLEPAEQDQLWSLVDTSAGKNSCWPWLGPTTSANTRKNGQRYTVFHIHRLNSGYSAVRLVYGLHNNVILPQGVKLSRVGCDNTLCVNPQHQRIAKPNMYLVRGKIIYDSSVLCVNGHNRSVYGILYKSGGIRCRACARVHANALNRRLRSAKNKLAEKPAEVTKPAWDEVALKYLEETL